MLQPYVILRIGRQRLLLQTLVHRLRRQLADHREGRHADDHAHRPQDPAEEKDRKQHPETGKPRGIPKDLRSQDIAVKLLDQKDQHQEDQALFRTYQQQEQRARDRADERSEERYDIRHADDHADQHRIRHLKKAHDQEGQDADDQGVDQLAHDKAAEYLVDETAFLHQFICEAKRKQAVGNLLRLRNQRTLDVQQIDHDDEAKQGVLCHIDHPHDAGIDAAQGGFEVRHPVGGGADPFHQTIHDMLVGFHDRRLHLGIVCENAFEPAGNLLDVGRNGTHDTHDALDYGRDDHGDQTDDDRPQKDQAADGRQGLG